MSSGRHTHTHTDTESGFPTTNVTTRTPAMLLLLLLHTNPRNPNGGENENPPINLESRWFGGAGVSEWVRGWNDRATVGERLRNKEKPRRRRRRRRRWWRWWSKYTRHQVWRSNALQWPLNTSLRTTGPNYSCSCWPIGRLSSSDDRKRCGELLKLITDLLTHSINSLHFTSLDDLSPNACKQEKFNPWPV